MKNKITNLLISDLTKYSDIIVSKSNIAENVYELVLPLKYFNVEQISIYNDKFKPNKQIEFIFYIVEVYEFLVKDMTYNIKYDIIEKLRKQNKFWSLITISYGRSFDSKLDGYICDERLYWAQYFTSDTTIENIELILKKPYNYTMDSCFSASGESFDCIDKLFERISSDLRYMRMDT